MITAREILLGIVFLFMPRPWGLVLFYLVLFLYVIVYVCAATFSAFIVTTKHPSFVCYKLQVAGHPSYQEEQCVGGGVPYIPALKRRPSKRDLFFAVMSVSVRGKYSIFLAE